MPVRVASPRPAVRSRDEWLSWLARAPRVIPGTPEEIYHDAYALASLLGEQGLLLRGQRILDFGCGIGKLAIPLAERPVEYAGLDVRRDSIAFCRKAFAPWPHLSFQRVRVRNAYYSRWALASPEKLALPYADRAFDAALAISVFTHLETEKVCVRALRELRRVLRPGGALFCTWFRSPPNELSSKPARRVYPEEDIRRMLASGFQVRNAFGGETCGHDDQWCVVATAL